MQDKYPEALVERCVQLVRAVVEADDKVGDHLTAHRDVEIAKTARAIVAELPEPVDPDLIEAREIAAQAHERESYCDIPVSIRSGAYDTFECYYVPACLAAIKRGRELQKEQG